MKRKKGKQVYFKRLIFISFGAGLLLGVAIVYWAAIKYSSFVLGRGKPKENTQIESGELARRKVQRAKGIEADSNQNSTLAGQERNSNVQEVQDSMSQYRSLEIIEKREYFPTDDKDDLQKDQLKAFWKFKVPGKQANPLDSILLDLPEDPNQDLLIVEFWYSPMNYSGYQLQSDRLIIFGVSNREQLNFYWRNDSLFIQIENLFMYLKDCEDLSPIPYPK